METSILLQSQSRLSYVPLRVLTISKEEVYESISERPCGFTCCWRNSSSYRLQPRKAGHDPMEVTKAVFIAINNKQAEVAASYFADDA